MPPKQTHHHRSSTNVPKKAFKGWSRNATKRAVGRTEDVQVSQKVSTTTTTKADKIHHAKQLQENKRKEVLLKKRLGSRNGPPKLIGIVLLSPDVDLGALAQIISTECTLCQTLKSSLPFVQTMSAKVENREGRFTFLVCPRDPVAVADVAKAADIVYFVMKPKLEDEDLNVDMLGNHFLQLVKAQGLPAVCGIAQGVDKMEPKVKAEVTKLVTKYYKTVFDNDVKTFLLDTQTDMKNLLRWTYHTIPRSITWRDDRVRLLGEHVEYILNSNYPVALEHNNQNTSDKSLYDLRKGTLRVTGYLRGDHSISSNQLVHITGFGDYQIINIEGYSEDTVPPRLRKGESYPQPRVLSVSTAEHRETLSDLISNDNVNTMNNEQSVITEEELADAVRSNPELAQTSSMFTTDAEGNVNVNTSSTSTNTTSSQVYHDWKAQDVALIDSKSSLSSGTAVMAQKAQVFTADAIAQTKGQDENGLITSVWNTIDVEDEEDEHTLTAKNQQQYGGDDDDLHVDEMDDQPMDADAIRAVKKTLRREANIAEGFDDTASVMTNFTGFSMGSLRYGTDSKEEVAAKFSELPYKEKVRRLLKYGQKGEDRLVKEKKKLEKADQMNPDEVDFDPNITARARFARYRGIKSFKHSAWDHQENLPVEYSQIFQFANFDISMRNAKDACLPVLEDEEDMYDATDKNINGERAMPVTFTIANVAPEAAEMMINSKAFALLWGLYRHEHKVTVMHTYIRRHEEYALPIRGKDPMHVQVGFRRFTTSPIFSKVVQGTDKTMVTRYLPNDGKFYLSSFYARVCFPPATVLMFHAQVLGSYKNEFPFNPLVASGTLHSCNPNKIILKRSVLTGYPITVSNNKAVVRHMFFNANDVRWFKPVEIWTKSGRHGHITEPRGLHGLFKCAFDNTLKHKEPVSMSLYKRQFPPWNPAYLG